MSEFKRKSTEIANRLRDLLGFKVCFEEKSVKLIHLKNRDNFLLFRVRFVNYRF